VSEPVQHLGLAPGIHYNISESDYHADLLCDRPTLSRSEAKVLLDESPLHLWAKHPRLHAAGAPKKVTKAMDFGSGAHAIALGKGADIVTVEADDWKTKAAREARDAIRESGKTPMLEKEKNDADVVVTALRIRLKEFGLDEKFDAAKSEAVLLWEENPHCFCRVMADKLLIDEATGSAHFFDIKFTDSANPVWLPRQFDNLGYALQDQWYTHGLLQLLPRLGGRVTFTFLMQETDYPYLMVPVQLGGEFQCVNISKVMRAIAKWTQCMENNRWPGYTKEILKLEAPPWLLAKEIGAPSI